MRDIAVTVPGDIGIHPASVPVDQELQVVRRVPDQSGETVCAGHCDGVVI